MAKNDLITPLYPDSTDTEDTLQYMDGADSIILLSEDTLSGFLRSDLTLSQPITIQFGNNMGTVTRGVFGINTSGMFDVGTLPNEAGSEYGWQYLIDLAPEVLRFPSGANAKFMHLLHDSDGNESIGYGYDIFDMARYYDFTDGVMDFDHDELTSDEIEQILYDTEAELISWIAEPDNKQFTKLRVKYFQQQCASTRYIDDFIALVNSIDAAYPDRPKVRVLLCLNIFSETATESRAVADYLRTNGVNVAGVELGNETYSDFHCNVLGFQEFDDYYQYIQGTTFVDHALFMTATMNSDHDYITAFKPSSGYNYNLGISGAPLGPSYAFRTPEALICSDVVNWNAALKATYNEKIDGTKYKYNAVVLHTYNESDNWNNIPIDEFNEQLTCSNPSSDLWNFIEYDEDLRAAFDGIIGVGGLQGNFHDFLTKNNAGSLSYQESMDAFNIQLDFALPVSSGGKYLWNTEWNLKDEKDQGAGSISEDIISRIYTNGFTHGHLLLNWWLKNIKINFNNDFRPGFMQYATLQNFAGGSGIDLLNPATIDELTYYEKDECPYKISAACNGDCESRNYYIRRTTWFTTYLLSTIWKDNLKYLRLTYLVPHGEAHNVAPTSFIDPQKENLYVFYSNAKEEPQNYKLVSTNLSDLFPESPYVGFGTAMLTYLEGQQPYSTSGKSELYNSDYVNVCYSTNTAPFEIKADAENTVAPAIQSMINIPDCTGIYETNGCLTAPKHSMGFFKIPILTGESPFRMYEATSTQEDWSLYPNPTEFKVFVSNLSSNNIWFDYTITNLTGLHLISGTSQSNTAIDIAALMPGFYILNISTSLGILHHLPFIVQ